MSEVWVDIPDYEGYYQVSNMGRIKGVARRIAHKYSGFQTLKSKILKDHNVRGYRYVTLTKNCVRKDFKVHRIVMLAFCYEDKRDVNHMNKIKSDNRLSNLEYTTKRENMTHRVDKTKTLSRYYGVCKRKDRNNKPWQASLYYKKKTVFIGNYKTEEEAFSHVVSYVKEHGIKNKYIEVL